MIKHRLMLSAAAAVLLASPMAARADLTIDTARDTQVTTSGSGSITITNAGNVSLRSNGAAVVLNSNHFVTNNGLISNLNTSGAIGVLIDTSAQVIVARSPGFLSTNTIALSGTGDNKVGLLISGANPYFGNITVNASTPTSSTGAGAAIIVEGDNSAAFRLLLGSRVDGDITFGGSISGLPTAKSTAASGSSLFLFDGDTNGNVYFDSSAVISNSGSGARGVAVLGAIKACTNSANSAAQLAAGFTCVTDNGKGSGSLINAGKIVSVGQITIDPTSKEPLLEGGSVLQIGNSIEGGFYQSGPATANGGLPQGVLSGNGANGSAVLRIDPLLAATTGSVRGPINIGILPVAIDGIDGGKYSILNRGNIVAQPTGLQVSTQAVFIQGASAQAYTCLGNGNFDTCGSDNLGGILSTGAITATANTNATSLVTNNVSANAITVGAYAAIPRLDIQAQDLGNGATTSGLISANVTGTSGGIANALFIGQGARVPVLNISQGASINALVETTTLSPTVAVGNSSAPFTLVAQTIVDTSGSLKTINNAGTISARVTAVAPALDAVVVTTVRAIDLVASTANDVTINNSGRITGDILFGAGGNNFALNVGNLGGARNPAIPAGFGGLNTPSNYAIVAGTIESAQAGFLPTTVANLIDFGAGTGHSLTIGSFGYVNSVIKASASTGVAVTVQNNGTLFVANSSATGSLNASTFNIQTGGTLGLTVSQNTTATSPVIRALTSATIAANSSVALQFGSFISSADVFAPVTQDIVLITAPVINIDATTLAQNNLELTENLPFLFQANATPLRTGTAGGNQTLVLALTPRVPGLGTAANPGLGLSGDALAQFSFVAKALATDPSLGSTIASSLTVYRTPGVASSGINIAASQQQAQQAFVQFGPDTSGGAKQVAIMITDQATGPVAARQRLLRSYNSVPGDMTLWAEEFFGNINNKGRVSADGSLTNYKDHGFGFTLGMDTGSPRGGWYGGAFTFYSGDVSQTLPRDTKTQTQWYMLTGYSHWKGRRLFVDTQVSFGYGDFVGTRDLTVGGLARQAGGKRATLMGALGGKMGAVYGSSAFQLAPYLSLDGLTMREEGYTETGGGPGFNLQVAPYYANSLRTALGVDLKTGFNLLGARFTPEARFGYRYDLVNSPVKLRAAFVSTGGLGTVGNDYNFIGPDPDTGNMFGGLSLGAGTESWQLGVNFDLVRGNNGSTTQVGTVTLLGRI